MKTARRADPILSEIGAAGLSINLSVHESLPVFAAICGGLRRAAEAVPRSPPVPQSLGGVVQPRAKLRLMGKPTAYYGKLRLMQKILEKLRLTGGVGILVNVPLVPTSLSRG